MYGCPDHRVGMGATWDGLTAVGGLRTLVCGPIRVYSNTTGNEGVITSDRLFLDCSFMCTAVKEGGSIWYRPNYMPAIHRDPATSEKIKCRGRTGATGISKTGQKCCTVSPW
eukprot:4712347-Prymnesium_polylepis.1